MTDNTIGPGRIAKIGHALALSKRDGPEKLTQRELAVFAQGDWNQIRHDLTELVHELPKLQMYLQYLARRAQFDKLSTEDLLGRLELGQGQPPRKKTSKTQVTIYSVEYIILQILAERGVTPQG